MPPSSSESARLEFQLTPDRGLRGALLLVGVALVLSVAGLGSLAIWQRALVAAFLLLLAAGGAARMLPGAHPAAISRLSFDSPLASPVAGAVTLCLRDGVERRAVLCAGSIVLTGWALLVCRFDGDCAAMGPGQRLPRRVCALLLAANHPPADWRRLQWRLRWPPQRH